MILAISNSSRILIMNAMKVPSVWTACLSIFAFGKTCGVVMILLTSPRRAASVIIKTTAVMKFTEYNKDIWNDCFYLFVSKHEIDDQMERLHYTATLKLFSQ